VITATITF